MKTLQYVSSYYWVSVCPHTTCVLILLQEEHGETLWTLVRWGPSFSLRKIENIWKLQNTEKRDKDKAQKRHLRHSPTSPRRCWCSSSSCVAEAWRVADTVSLLAAPPTPLAGLWASKPVFVCCVCVCCVQSDTASRKRRLHGRFEPFESRLTLLRLFLKFSLTE